MVAGLLAACASAPAPSLPGSAPTPQPAAAYAAPDHRQGVGPAPVQPSDGGRRSGGGAGADASVGVPPGFPTALPVPAGTVQSAAGSVDRWSMLILAAGSAPDVKRAAVDLYTAHGFTTPSPDSIPVTLTSAAYTVTLLVENRDHSASATVLSLNVTRN